MEQQRTSEEPARPRQTHSHVTLRALGPRRGLPSTRAVIGGLLVAVALVATWWGASGTAGAPRGRLVVAARAIAPGTHIADEDVRTIVGALPAGTRGHGFARPETVLGTVATGPIAEGDPVLRSAVTPSTGSTRVRELSFVVDAAWAAGGSLRVGDHIDVLVTYGDGLSSRTTRVLADVAVRRLSSTPDQGLGSTRSQTITVAIGSVRGVQAATNAARAGMLTIARASGATPTASPPAYRPPAKGRHR